MTTSFLKERGVKPVSFYPAEVVMLGLAVTISLGPAEVVMIVKVLNVMLAKSAQCLRRDNKDNDIDKPHHSGLIT